MFPYHPLRVPPVLGNPSYFPSLLLRHTVFTSPIDLSTRTLTPITPPTTPSPIRNRMNINEFVTKNSANKTTTQWKCNESSNSNSTYFQAIYKTQSTAKDDLDEQQNSNHDSDRETFNSKDDIDTVYNDKCSYDLNIKDNYESSDEDAFVDILTQDDVDVSCYSKIYLIN